MHYIFTNSKSLEIFRKAYENDKLIVAEVPAKFKERFERTKLQNNSAEDVIILG